VKDGWREGQRKYSKRSNAEDGKEKRGELGGRAWGGIEEEEEDDDDDEVEV
jgi:hypothetical protein